MDEKPAEVALPIQKGAGSRARTRGAKSANPGSKPGDAGSAKRGAAGAVAVAGASRLRAKVGGVEGAREGGNGTGAGLTAATPGGERRPVMPGDAAKAVMDALAGRFTPEVLCAKLENLMGFERTYMNRNGDVMSSPDGAVQLKAVETIIAYLVGRPIERQQVMTVAQPATMDDLLEKARKSPVFRSTLRQLLDGLDAAV